jgi:hypothetical protein
MGSGEARTPITKYSERGPVWSILAGTLVYSTLFAVIGVGLGTLLRNQVLAVAGALAWVAVVEHILVNLIPEIGKWLPTAAGQAIVRTPLENLLSPLAGAVLLGHLRHCHHHCRRPCCRPLATSDPRPLEISPWTYPSIPTPTSPPVAPSGTRRWLGRVSRHRHRRGAHCRDRDSPSQRRHGTGRALTRDQMCPLNSIGEGKGRFHMSNTIRQPCACMS